MIWDFIRDFIVQYITGGMDSNGIYYYATGGNISHFVDYEFDEPLGSIVDIQYIISGGSGRQGEAYTIGLADWLATTLTTICMCLIVAFAIWLVCWVFKAVAHAFLLRK